MNPLCRLASHEAVASSSSSSGTGSENGGAPATSGARGPLGAILRALARIQPPARQPARATAREAASARKGVGIFVLPPLLRLGTRPRGAGAAAPPRAP